MVVMLNKGVMSSVIIPISTLVMGPGVMMIVGEGRSRCGTGENSHCGEKSENAG